MLCAPDGYFRDRLHDLMYANSCTGEELARLTGISQHVVAGYLAGKSPDTLGLLRIARLFEVSMEWLITGKEGAHTAESAYNALAH